MPKNLKPNKNILEENSKKVYKLSNLKNEFIIYLNNNPLTKYKIFKNMQKSN